MIRLLSDLGAMLKSLRDVVFAPWMTHIFDRAATTTQHILVFTRNETRSFPPFGLRFFSRFSTLRPCQYDRLRADVGDAL